MEERDMIPMDIHSTVVEEMSGDGQDVIANEINTEDAEATDVAVEAPEGEAGEEAADNTEAQEQSTAPAADAGITAVDGTPHEEGGALSTANEITGEPPDWSELCTVYPDVDPALMEQDTTVCALLRGEIRPTPRQAYEITHLEAIVEARVAERIEAAVRESEARILDHIRTCGHRPVENGVRAAAGVRMHPAVGRLTRSDRAALAKRAERGETIRL